jgi:transposase
MAMKTKELELSRKIERRLEMIHAHTKLGKTVRSVIEEFNVSLGTYYYWYPLYVKMGIFGLFDSKRGPKTPYNKASSDIASKVVETAKRHQEIDAPEILEMLECSSDHKPSVSTVQRILRSNGMNRQKGRHSKKTMEKKRTAIQVQKREQEKEKRHVKDSTSTRTR